MKLRYYMRGLGIGIIVTAFIMGIASMRSDTLNEASDLQSEETQTGEAQRVVLSDLMTEAENEQTSQVIETEEMADAEKTEETADAEETEKETEGLEESGAEVRDSAQETEESGQETETVRTADDEAVIFIIKSGTGSETVSRELAEAGLIQDASAFNKFLCDNGYSKSIRAGSFEIPVGAGEEEIAGIITGGR